MTIQLLVRFEPGRDGNVVGRIEAVVGGDCATNKIALPEHGHRGVSPKRGELWVCAFMRDTQPGARKGAIIVRPLRQPKWAWQEVGEPLWGVRRREPVCGEFPELSVHLAPFSPQQWEAANAAYRAAEEKEEARKSGSLRDFVKVFGQPNAFEKLGENEFVAVAGSVTSRPFSSFQIFDFYGAAPTVRWRETAQEIEEEERLAAAPITLTRWRQMGMKGPYAFVSEKSLARFSEEEQEKILSILRSSIPTAEAFVAKRWEEAFQAGQHTAKELEEVRMQIRALLGPCEGYALYGNVVQGGDVLSPDERGWRSSSWEEWKFHVLGRLNGRAGGWCSTRREIPGGLIHVSPGRDEFSPEVGFKKTLSPEELLGVRDRVVARLRARLVEILAREGELALKNIGQNNNPRIHGDRAGWVSAAHAEWARRTAAELTAWEAEDQALIAAAHAEWAARNELLAEFEILRKEADGVSARLYKFGLGEFRASPIHVEVESRESEELRADITATRAWIAAAEEAIAATLAARHEREVAARASAEEAARALAEAMATPATPTPWFLSGVEAARVEALIGRKAGEGVGDRVAGVKENLYLPGDRPVVAVRFSGGVSRYHTSIKYSGLVACGKSLPIGVGKWTEDAIAVANDASWSIATEDTEHGNPYQWGLITSAGRASLCGVGDDARYSAHGWDGTEGVGPSEAEVRAAHGLAPRRSVAAEPLSDDDKSLETILGRIGEGDRALAQVLADRAVAVCGRGAEEFLASVDGAGYGRARRQADLRERLGEEGIETLLEMRRASDMNAILYAALRLVREKQPVAAPAAQPPKSPSPTPKAPAPAPVAAPQQPAASLADLMSRFGKKR